MKTWKNGSVLVGNQRMEVTEDLSIEATCLEMDGINLFRDKKVLDRVVNVFIELD